MLDLDSTKALSLASLFLAATAFGAEQTPRAVSDLTVNPDSPDGHYPLPARYAVVSDSDVSETRPTSVMLPDGKTVYAFWDLHHGGPCGPAAVSSDGGRTWTDVSDRIPAAFRSAYDTPSAFGFVDPKSGRTRIRVFASYGAAERYDWRGPDDRPLAEAMPSILSEDDGRTWKALPPLGADFACVNCFSGAARLKDGLYLAVFSRGKNPNGLGSPWSVMSSRSRDGGLTWEKPRLVTTQKDVRHTEPTLCVSPDGEELCCLVGTDWGEQSQVLVSKDGGTTWSAPKDLAPALAGARHQVTVLPDGRYVATFRRDKGVWGWIGDYKALRDGTGAGGQRVRLFHNYGNGEDCGSAGVHALKDGTILAVSQTVYSPFRPLASVVSMRFSTREVDEGSSNRETALRDFDRWKPFEKSSFRPLTSARMYGPFAQALILRKRDFADGVLSFDGTPADLKRVTGGRFNEAESKSGAYLIERFRGNFRGNAAVLVWTVKVAKDCRAKLRLHGAPAYGCWFNGRCLKRIGPTDLLVPGVFDLDLKAGDNDIFALVANPFYLFTPPANAADPLRIAAGLSGVEFTCVDPGRDLELKTENLSISDDLGEGF